MTTSVVDWEVVFNRDVSSEENYSASDIASEAAVSELLCDIQRTSSDNMLADTGYKERGGNTAGLNTASGIAVSGAVIYNALDSDNLDAVE